MLATAPAAPASDESMRVNEVYPAAPGEAFVELLDVFPSNDQFRDANYFVASYDAADNPVDRQTYSPPYPFAKPTPFVLGSGGDGPPLALAPGAGKVCFESNGIFNEQQMHCLGYDSVPPGRSVQRQHCGRAGTAAPTRGQENAEIAAVCAGQRIGCDDPRRRVGTEPKLRVIGKKVQDVDRFAVRFRLNRDGDVGIRGSVSIQGKSGIVGGFAYGAFRLKLRAGVPARFKIPIPSRFKRQLKRALRRGQTAAGSVVSVARDNHCPPNRFHSSRSYRLTN